MDAENNEKRIAEDGVKVGKNVKKGIEKMRARIGKESEEKRRVVKKMYFLRRRRDSHETITRRRDSQSENTKSTMKAGNEKRMRWKKRVYEKNWKEKPRTE